MQDVVAILQRRRHELRRLIGRIAEHNALIARALILGRRGIDALCNMGRLTMEVASELGLFPMEALLLVANIFDRGANLGL